jgi:tRNA pseudouridine38-40 synthase
VPRYKLTIAYDGTEFCGWQKQFPHADAVPAHMHGFKATDPEDFALDTSSTSPDGEVVARRPVGAPDFASRSTFPSDSAPDDAASSPHHPVTPSPAHSPDRPRRELRTVQSVVERAVRQVVREPVIVNGASRTDAGVHARGQVASFLTLESGQGRSGGGWPADRGTLPLMRAVNARLPDDVLVRSIEVVPDEFNPIMGAVSKGYTYTLWCSDHRPLWPRRTAMHFWQRMDVEAMRAAAAEIVGTHDFKAFAAAGHGRLTTVRTVFGCEVVEEEREGARGQGRGSEEKEGIEAGRHQGIESWPTGLNGEADGPVQKLVIRVWGNGFLWNMVRIIAGTLVEAGKGKCGPERVREALRTGNRRLAGSTLPAHGLCLEWIRYGEVGASIVVNEE